MQIQTAEMSEQGGRAQNEDRVAVARNADMLCCVLADGAGGHGDGGVAAQIAVQAVLDAFARLRAQEAPFAPATAVRLLLHANDAVVQAQVDGLGSPRMRTTGVALLIDCATLRACWAYCGDSRLYCLRDGAVLARTRDHSLVQQMVDAGMLDAAGARSHPNRNVLSSALGVPEHVEIGASDALVELREGDSLLLCSDGVWDYADDGEIAAAGRSARDPAGWLAVLQAAVRAKARPGHDNYSAVAVWVGEVNEVTRMSPPRVPQD